MWKNNDITPKQGIGTQRGCYERDKIKISKRQTTQDQINLIKTKQMQFLLKRGNMCTFVETKIKVSKSPHPHFLALHNLT